jgi:hypothetical protein
MPLSIVATDLNGDGKPDIAVMDWDDATIHVFAGNGDGTFGTDTEFGGSLNMSWLGYGNYQGQTKNGYPDLVKCGRCGRSNSMGSVVLGELTLRHSRLTLTLFFGAGRARMSRRRHSQSIQTHTRPGVTLAHQFDQSLGFHG